MECNREEALKARDLAEKKLQGKDFTGARKFALKAQQLDPETEDISRMICVCDVHCAAENKVCGEVDWYGILQIQQTADDILIKKQYRKFALLLHPDKNNFAGAEAAFKLIGEAQRVLLDKEKRQQHDARRSQPNILVTPHQQGEAGVANGGTFWTQCRFCLYRYQYYKNVMGKSVLCQKCKQTFLAFQTNAPGTAAFQPVFPQPNASGINGGSEAKNTKPPPNTASEASQKAELKRPPVARQSKARPTKAVEGERASKLRKLNGHTGKKHVEDSSIDLEEVDRHENTGTSREQSDKDERQTSRPTPKRRQVSNTEHATKIVCGLSAFACDNKPIRAPLQRNKPSNKPSRREVCLGLMANRGQ